LESVRLHLETLDVGDTAHVRDIRLIDDEEKSRATQFRFALDAARFVARRGRLREILAGYTGEAPERLRFAQGSHGKPVLADSPLQFSLSHSHGRIMVAVADVAVGCDIEWIDPDLDWRPIADRLFAPAEAEALRALPATQARRGFFDCWSRKEAYVKALGLGLSYPLDAFVVSVDREARLSAGLGRAIADITCDAGYSGAVVADADAIRLDVAHGPSPAIRPPPL
jgi:4'-phosphopantetheinyl transferase